MDVYLVRHGEAAASWGQSADPGLSELGQRQAQDVAQALLPQLAPHTRLFSSPLARARETAAPLGRELGAEVAISDVFREIPAPVPLPERQTWLRGFMRQRWEEQPESLHAWRDSAFQTLLALDTPAVIFTHFLVINAVVGRVQDRPETCCFMPDNGSITHLRLEDGALELAALGRELETVVN
ncbi:MAG: histidine phosphatase family protein [Halioglobus sp.]|nr:histidine phosphatase family protein [Halioglobus sp.]